MYQVAKVAGVNVEERVVGNIAETRKQMMHSIKHAWVKN